MDRRINRAEQYFGGIGLRQLTGQEITGIAATYNRDARAGIAGDSSASLRMTDTLLKRSQRGLKPGTQALVLEVGGTNFSSSHFVVNEQGELDEMISHHAKIPSTNFPSSDAFFGYLASEVRRGLSGVELVTDVVSGIYSYPGESMRSKDGSVDVMSDESLPKGAVIPGISREPVGQALVRKLVTEGVLERPVPVLILNDTPAVLLSHPDARIGAVLGTGFNIATTDLDGRILSSESGGFRYLPMPMYVQEADQQSENSGRQYTEKQVGGKDVGRQFNGLVTVLSQMHLLENVGPSREFTSVDVADLLNHQGPEALGEGLRSANRGDFEILQNAAHRLVARSSQIFGVMAGVSVNKAYPESDHKVEIPVEGSFFWGARTNQFDAVRVATEVSNRQIAFVEGCGKRGAADAALRLIA